MGQAPLFVVTQAQHDLVFGRQARQRGGNGAVFGPARDFIGRMNTQSRAARHHNEIEGRWLLRLAAAFARRDTTRPMSRNGAQPARKTRDFGQLRQLAKSDQKRFLRHFFGHGARANFLLRDRSHRVAVASHQHIEGFQIAQQSPDHQLVIADF